MFGVIIGLASWVWGRRIFRKIILKINVLSIRVNKLKKTYYQRFVASIQLLSKFVVVQITLCFLVILVMFTPWGLTSMDSWELGNPALILKE